MATEIERKFQVTGDFKSQAHTSYRITQGYLSSVPERTVRVRLRDNEAFLTIKGSSHDKGVSRFEWEKQISVEDAGELLKICEAGVVDKTRYLVKAGKHTYEVDEFHGENEGLVIAEIELETVTDEFIKPEWLGKEVTGDSRYYNASLVYAPYSQWKKYENA